VRPHADNFNRLLFFIHKHGYHRRDQELADAKKVILS